MLQIGLPFFQITGTTIEWDVRRARVAQNLTIPHCVCSTSHLAVCAATRVCRRSALTCVLCKGFHMKAFLGCVRTSPLENRITS